MQAGKARYRIEWVKRDSTTQDSFGADVRRFISQGVFWGIVEELKGTELSRALVTWPKARYKVTVRSPRCNRVEESDFFIFGNRFGKEFLNILHVKRLEESGRLMIAVCENTTAVTVEPSDVISGVTS